MPDHILSVSAECYSWNTVVCISSTLPQVLLLRCSLMESCSTSDSFVLARSCPNCPCCPMVQEPDNIHVLIHLLPVHIFPIIFSQVLAGSQPAQLEHRACGAAPPPSSPHRPWHQAGQAQVPQPRAGKSFFPYFGSLNPISAYFGSLSPVSAYFGPLSPISAYFESSHVAFPAFPHIPILVSCFPPLPTAGHSRNLVTCNLLISFCCILNRFFVVLSTSYLYLYLIFYFFSSFFSFWIV